MASADRLDRNAADFGRCLHCEWSPASGPMGRTRTFSFGARRALGILVVVIARIRLARENDTALLSVVERSAARRFRMVPGLEWLAEGGVLGEAVHLGCIRGGTCWVAVDEHDDPVGFLSAEAVAERELHIHEMSVSETFQGHGIGRALL